MPRSGREAVANLLTIVTERVRVSLSGPVHPRSERETTVRAIRGEAMVHAAGARGHADPDWSGPLAVPEEAVLSLLVQSRTGAPVDVSHRDPSQTAGLTLADGGRVLHGSVRVRDEVGVSVFEVRAGGAPEVTVALAVAPTKLGEGDVAAMRQDVEAAWRGAALAAWGATTGGSTPEAPPSQPAWLALLRHAARALGASIAAIARRPDVELREREHARPLAQVRGDARGLRAVRRGRGSGPWESVGEHAARSVIRTSRLSLSEDTPANRWIRQRLDAAVRRLAEIRREEAAHPYASAGRRAALRADLDRLDTHLRRLAGSGLLAQESARRAPVLPPLVLRRRPAYRAAYDALRLIESGLDVAEGEVETAWLGTARLYETWAALQTVNAVAGVLGAELPAAPFGVVASGARIRVGRGRDRSVVLRGVGAEVEVIYEPRFGARPALLAQRPDLLLTVRWPGEPSRRAVLDAKYRRDDSAAYARRHGTPGPPDDALGDLHRYRDAIVDARGRPLVERAAALFPLHADAAFADSRLWRAHGEVGVGAVPLAPGTTGFLTRWLTTWIGDDGLRTEP